MLTIRPYQSDGLEFLTSRRHALLADRPGLGKTMQALLSMRDLVPDGRVLVVATGDAIGVWQDEIDKWLGETPEVISGPGADPLRLAAADGFVITNYSRLAIALEQSWDGVIFDESQMLRNRKTRTLFAAVKAAFNKSRRHFDNIPVFFLSGTPIVKAAGDLWPILYLIDQRRWSSYWRFVQKYAIVWEDQFGWHVEGVTNAKGLWAELEDVCLRRTEGQVPLPPKIRQQVPLTMTARQARAYRDLEADMIAEIDEPSGLLLAPSVLALETRLRQLLACPRILGVADEGAAIAALVSIAERSADPFVVFSPFAEALPFIEAALVKTGRRVFVVHGGMGERFRESVANFKTTAKTGSILLSTVQMGKGWNVAEVTHEAYFLEFDWNATTHIQAESRLHRDGQLDTVFARYFVHEDTHDLNALDVLAGKKRLADVILDRTRQHSRKAARR